MRNTGAQRCHSDEAGHADPLADQKYRGDRREHRRCAPHDWIDLCEIAMSIGAHHHEAIDDMDGDREGDPFPDTGLRHGNERQAAQCYRAREQREMRCRNQRVAARLDDRVPAGMHGGRCKHREKNFRSHQRPQPNDPERSLVEKQADRKSRESENDDAGSRRKTLLTPSSL